MKLKYPGIQYSKFSVATLSAAIVLVMLTGCQQTLILKPDSSINASAVVTSQILYDSAQISVFLDRKIYSGEVIKPTKQATDEQAIQFGWQPGHKHRNIKQEMLFFFGTTTLNSVDGTTLTCDHLKHGDNWRLRCIANAGKIVFFSP